MNTHFAPVLKCLLCLNPTLPLISGALKYSTNVKVGDVSLQKYFLAIKITEELSDKESLCFLYLCNFMGQCPYTNLYRVGKTFYDSVKYSF